MTEVAIIMGSQSDQEAMTGAREVLDRFGISWEQHIMSAHRTPEAVAEFAGAAAQRGIKVLIAGAGWAAHLAGALAGHSILPVIGVPLASSPLQGFDSLLATVQMPPGIPVATVAVGCSANAAHLAAQILALSNPDLAERITAFRNQWQPVKDQGSN